MLRGTAFTFANTRSTWWRSVSRLDGSAETRRLRLNTFCPSVNRFSWPQIPTTPHFQRQFHQSSIYATDWSHLKKCSDLGFCRRQRHYRADADGSYTILKSSIQVSVWCDMPAVMATMASRDGSRNKLSLAVIAFEKGLFRVAISDFENPLHERYIVDDVAMHHCKALPIDDTMLSVAEEYATISMADRKNGISIHFDPFRLDLVTQDTGKTAVSVNSESRLMMEDYARTPLFQYDDTLEEHFGDHIDAQHRGPESVGVDILFPSAEHLHGVPERTSPLSLPETKSSSGEFLSEPYRMYNLDVNHFELDKPLGLYGSIPLLYAKNGSSAAGIFWNNASETYVDVQTAPMKPHTKATHWFSESGIVDIFLLPGPSANDVFKQYLFLTGSPTLPPLFALGYNQCRYSYEDEADVREVDAGFNSRNIPYDVMWLDIDHTDGKRYFTWDYEKYPDPVKLQEDLAKNGRKTVAIIDPHIKRDDTYPLHALASKEGLYVRWPDGSDYEGKCWAGNSSYLNFLSPRVRNEWGNRFKDTLYPGMTEHLHVWNDMNEPSVFDGPEGTMPKNVVHDSVEHRHVHNLYGHSMARATYEGLLKNRPDQRPFVLTRSFFAGTQRFAAVWTGDNTACWAHLQHSMRMVTALQICGIGLSGADVGGFFGDPSGELAVRWYQAGAFQPFFRGHSDKGTKRREPWLFGKEITEYMRQAIYARYEFLTYWYTLFASLVEDIRIENGGPPMRPVWWEFDGWDEEENMWLVGDSLLVSPVMEQGAQRHVFDIPEGRWYDVYNGYREVGGKMDVEVVLKRMFVLLRGGKVVPRMVSDVRSSMDIGQASYSLMIGLDDRKFAEGVGYFDDGISQSFRHGDLCVIRWRYENDVLRAERTDGKFVGEGKVKTVTVCGFGNRRARKVSVDWGDGMSEKRFTQNVDAGSVRVEDVDVNIANGIWTMTIET